MSDVFVPDRFRKTVLTHTLKNLKANKIFSSERDGNPPLVLGIHGPSGDGKTFQTRYVLESANIKVFSISGGELESADAGEPSRLIRMKYFSASQAVKDGKAQYAVLLFDDFDAGVGDWGALVQYTVNRQSIFAQLMNLCDDPQTIQGESVLRIPIIITGNDFTKLYHPLVRAGRMVAFEWIATLSEKIEIIQSIFKNLNEGESRTLVESLDRFSGDTSQSHSLPIAFYRHLKSSITDDELWRQINSLGIKEWMKRCKMRTLAKVDHSHNLNDLILYGKEILKAGQLINHLRREQV